MPEAAKRHPSRAVVSQLFADDLQVVVVIVDGLGRAEVENGPAIGFPMIAVESEDGGAGLKIADRVRAGVQRAVELFRNALHRKYLWLSNVCLKKRAMASGSASEAPELRNVGKKAIDNASLLR